MAMALPRLEGAKALERDTGLRQGASTGGANPFRLSC